MPLLSVVSPVYQAERCIPELCGRLISTLSRISDDFEILLVEDRSQDQSWKCIQEESAKDDRVVGIRLARNFGQHRAITAGLDVAEGDWVIVMDCDLQDPPEKIQDLYDKAIQGFEIVLAQFVERTEPRVRQYRSKLFWRLLSWLAGIEFDPRVGNFRIMSQRVVRNFRRYREQLRFLGGITSLMGFTTTSVTMTRDQRFLGETSYNFSDLLRIAIQMVMAYSDKPLRLSIAAGLIMAGLSVGAGVIILLLRLFDVITVSGWASVMVSLYFIGGLIIANLGFIGYYLGRTYDESKDRPLYIIESCTAERIWDARINDRK
jgi:dolichol-phosphate mannosyltransferase